MLTWLLLGLGLTAYIFRRRLMTRLTEIVPDRATRHRVVGTIIAAFVLTFVFRLAVRLIWG